MQAQDVRPGQTVLCDGTPSIVWRVHNVTPPKPEPAPGILRFEHIGRFSSQTFITFLVPNRDNVIQWILKTTDPVQIAPLEPI